MGKNEYFHGWYFKCQSESESIALIPAAHAVNGQHTCSLQLISGTESLNIPFPGKQLQISSDRPFAKLGTNVFSEKGICLDLHKDAFSITGALSFNRLSPIRFDIMGPFRYIPFMECRHSVFSMRHNINGSLRVNGKIYNFNNGVGYIEGDRGHSFPKQYVWTQCCFDEGSLMLAAAEIPLGSIRFTGIIGVIHLHGKEYRLATYLGAKVLYIKNGEIVIKQGDYIMTAALLDRKAYPLKAPADGAMKRTIRENISCHARYRLLKKDRVLLDFDSSKASFEYEYS